jgi:hypothetical protein
MRYEIEGVVFIPHLFEVFPKRVADRDTRPILIVIADKGLDTASDPEPEIAKGNILRKSPDHALPAADKRGADSAGDNVFKFEDDIERPLEAVGIG